MDERATQPARTARTDAEAPTPTRTERRPRPAPRGSPAWANRDFSSIPLRSVLRQLPASGGSALPAPVGDDLARVTGEPGAADGLRLHDGPASARAAAALSAEAFTIGDDIHLGAAASRTDRHLLVHEAAHALQQGGVAPPPTSARLSHPGDHFERNADAVAEAALGGGTVSLAQGATGLVQRKASDSVKDKLSYGLFDWAITDQEATDALAMLADLPDAELQAAVQELGSKYIGRLIDNVPSALRTGPEYQRVVQAAGTLRTLDYVIDRLSYGLFDWAITDEEVEEVYNVVANLSAPQKDDFWKRLEDKGLVDRLIDNGSEALERLYVRPWIVTIPRGEASTDWQKRVMKSILMETDSATTADLLLETRFDKVFGPLTSTKAVLTGDDKRTPSNFNVSQMRKLWTLLEALPPGHVADNPELDRITSYKEEGSGVYWGGASDEAALGGSESNDSFEHLLRHEVGHSVDAKMGAATDAVKAHAGWNTYGSVLEAAQDAVTVSDDAIAKLTGADRTGVESEMKAVMNDHSKGLSDLRAAIRALAFAETADEDRDKVKTDVVADPALRAVVDNREIEKKEPWWRANGGVSLGSGNKARIIQESYSSRNEWVSYDVSARQRAISQYQFRAPGEWFAEVYMKYYQPGSDGRDLLHQKDPDTETWFDQHVAGA